MIKPETVASFLGFAPGSVGSPEDIARWCREAELRLIDSGYVYDASVTPVPARQNSAERTVFVAVSPGFLWRFSGGNAWAMVGRDGLFGERFGVRAYAGYNRNGISAAHSRVAGLPLALGASGVWNGPGAGVGVSSATGLPREGSTAEGTFTAGWFFHPDFLVGVDASGSMPVTVADSIGVPNGAESVFSFQPHVRLRKYLVSNDVGRYGNESDVGADARAFAFPRTGAVKAELSGFVHVRPLPFLTLAGSGACGVSSGSAGFDLYATEDRSVRSGYAQTELRAASFYHGSAEIRLRVFSATVPPGFACGAQAFLFSDFAGIAASGKSPGFADGLSFADAYGIGARMLFDNPVFAYFSFSYGWNHEGRGRFMFAATAGF
jgi:hypothetical protein